VVETVETAEARHFSVWSKVEDTVGVLRRAGEEVY
jgi:hypothetical protein